MSALTAATAWARRLRRDVMTVYFAARDPRTPWPVRALALLVAAYALSPIDLIPDMIPVLGYLDDLILVPLGLLAVIRLLPPHVLEASRTRAETTLSQPRSWGAAAVIVMLWLGGAAALGWWWWH